MRTPPHTTNSIDPMDDCDDIFGPPRVYPIAYLPRNRPSMISAKYKQKEERRKVLKISLNKLKKIDDPDTNLRRSVLINNTMKRLQQETRDEKLQKQQLSYPRCYSNDSYLNIKSEFLKNEKALEVEEIDTTFANSGKIEDIVIENDFHARLEEEINNVRSTGINSLSDIVANDFASPSVVKDGSSESKKRPFEEPLDERDIQEVFSQLFMPPTSGMDDDDQIEADPLAKRLKLEEDHQFPLHTTDSLMSQTTYTDYTKSVTSFINNNIPSSRFSTNCVLESDSSSFSCGQASMFGEMQTNVYHNLIASLET